MALTLLSHGINRGAYIGNPDGADQTVVTIDTTGADFLWVVYTAAALHGDIDSFVDNVGNSYTQMPGYPGPGDDHRSVGNSSGIYWCVAPLTSATHTFTVTTGNPGATHATLAVSAWSGVKQTGPFNVQLWGSTNANPSVTGPLSSIAGVAFSVFVLVDDDAPRNGTGAVDSDWTLIDGLPATGGVTGTQGLYVAYRILTLPQSISASWTWADASAGYQAGMFVFELSSAPPPPTPPSGTVYQIRRQRRFMLPWDDANRMKFLSRLEVILQTGIGTVAITSPTVMLRLSKDGGKTWGNELDMSAGAIGAYSTRVFANRLGRGRNWVAEITVSDPVDWQMLSCLIDYEEGLS